MPRARQAQRLPREWGAREALRSKGQFWTPDWVADAMVAYAGARAETLFDPAAGEGAFYSALRRVFANGGGAPGFYGTDIDPAVLSSPAYEGAGCHVEERDFILDPPEGHFDGIVANPPYIRHHRLPPERKRLLKELSRRILGHAIDGRAGLHIYFLIQALNLLSPGGRLAFLLPADTCEGVFAPGLWGWITQNFRLDCVVTFDAKATPFPDVDTNAMVFFIRKDRPKKSFTWVRAIKPEGEALLRFVQRGFPSKRGRDLEPVKRDLDEALKAGLSRPPCVCSSRYTLGHFARTMRGVVTGANEFFFLTRARAEELALPRSLLKVALGRTRDVEGSVVTKVSLDALDAKGRPTLLFAPDGRPLDDFPAATRDYLRSGEERALHERVLLRTRRPWYKMEERVVPPLLFAYLGRRQARFIRNDAGVLPLTGFLCVYPHSSDPERLQALWRVISDPATVANLPMVGKSYGSGAIKVEPRALEKLPLPEELVQANGLASWAKPEQRLLFG